MWVYALLTESKPRLGQRSNNSVDPRTPPDFRTPRASRVHIGAKAVRLVPRRLREPWRRSWPRRQIHARAREARPRLCVVAGASSSCNTRRAHASTEERHEVSSVRAALVGAALVVAARREREAHGLCCCSSAGRRRCCGSDGRRRHPDRSMARRDGRVGRVRAPESANGARRREPSLL